VTAANMPVFGPLHGGGLVRCKLLATAASLLFGLGAIPASALAQDAGWVPSMVNPPLGWTSVDLFEDGIGYVHRTEQSGTFFWRTEDGGVTYLPLDPPPGFMVDFATGSLGFSASSRTLWQTTNGAGSWEQAALPDPAAGTQEAISALHAGKGEQEVLALGVVTEDVPDGSCPFNPFTQRSGVAVSTVGTPGWERVHLLDVPSRAEMIDMVDQDYGVVVVSETDWTQNGPCSFTGLGSLGQLVYVLERSAESGSLESRLVFDCRPRICGSVGVAAPGVFTLGFTDGGLAHTTDGGESFGRGRLDAPVADGVSDLIDEENLFWVTAMAFADADVGYAVTNGRGMWRTDDGGATWIAEPSTRDVYDIGIADIAVAGPDHALAGGPTVVVRRQPVP
jgi:hypothetical protein